MQETGIQAVVLTPEDLEALGRLNFIHVTGVRMVIEPKDLASGEVRILFPEDLGEEEGKPFLRLAE